MSLYKVCGCLQPGSRVSYGRLHTLSHSAWYYCRVEDCEIEEAQDLTTIDLASYSDYNGSAVERSNHRVLLEEFQDELVDLYGDHGSTSIAYLGKFENLSEGLREALGALEEYCIYSEDDHSNLEMEMQSEQWDDYACEEFRCELANAIVNRLGGDVSEYSSNKYHQTDAAQAWLDSMATLTSEDLFTMYFEQGSGQPYVEPGGSIAWSLDDAAKRIVRRQKTTRDILTWCNNHLCTEFEMPDHENAILGDAIFNWFLPFAEVSCDTQLAA